MTERTLAGTALHENFVVCNFSITKTACAFDAIRPFHDRASHWRVPEPAGADGPIPGRGLKTRQQELERRPSQHPVSRPDGADLRPADPHRTRRDLGKPELAARRAGQGISLTQTGNPSQRFVQHAADRFGWDFDCPPRTEDDLYDLHQLRQLAQRLRLARQLGRMLKLTANGRRLAADAERLWRATARGVRAV